MDRGHSISSIPQDWHVIYDNRRLGHWQELWLQLILEPEQITSEETSPCPCKPNSQMVLRGLNRLENT
jgi:hypothetical protein